MKRMHVAAFCAFSILLTGCTSNSSAADDSGSTHQENTQEVGSSQEAQEPSQQETASSSNDTSASSTNSGVEKQSFDNSEKAAAAISDYRTVKQTNIDLGHGITALQDAGAGHKFISWNEGNWLIKIDYPIQSKYAVKNHPDSRKLAETIVAYLETHYLPAPDNQGVIKIQGFKDSPSSVVKWQDGRVVYELKSEKNNPMELIKRAVEAGKNL
ncbi:hypothetical protein [Salibacterium qingdaonense]|uniref:Lipoprotein n=1 Tax=Salibacterium qingdaonense TaxID=266892 RepID=A0A1I4LVN4_9BACI|nr:hypothetical protein [Salibacterium qingdaonense]SFL94863.1 hypothetical protein SAMN04488054_10912 [Salibacterium qingdaonense]